jgi:hypothetical protein
MAAALADASSRGLAPCGWLGNACALRLASRTPSRVTMPRCLYTDAMNRSPFSPSTPLADLPSVGEARAARLMKLGLRTAKDALLHFPRGYKDFSGTHVWDDLEASRHAALSGEVVDLSSRTTAGGRSMVSMLVRCTGGSIRRGHRVFRL